MTRRRYVDGPFGQVHLREAGRPKTGKASLVCLHLSPMSSRIYEQFADAMSGRGRHVLALDTPGFGLSDRPPVAPAIGDYARSLVAVLDALDIPDPVDVLGYHTGAMIAVEAAVTWPERIRRLVLISAPIFTDSELAELRREYAPVEPKRDGSHLLTRWRRFAQHYLGHGMPLVDAAELFIEGFLGGRTEWWGHRAAFAYPAGMRLHEISQATLILNPEDDMRPFTDRAEGRLAESAVVRLNGWGHGFLDIHTDLVAELIESYLISPNDAPFASLEFPVVYPKPISTCP